MPSRGRESIKALALANDEGPLAGATTDTVVFSQLNGFVQQAKHLKPHSNQDSNPMLSHILAVENTTRTAALSFAQLLDKEQNKTDSELPKGTPRLVRQLDLIARTISKEIGPQIFKVELGSFDTHANQVNRHASLMA